MHPRSLDSPETRLENNAAKSTVPPTSAIPMAKCHTVFGAPRAGSTQLNTTYTNTNAATRARPLICVTASDCPEPMISRVAESDTVPVVNQIEVRPTSPMKRCAGKDETTASQPKHGRRSPRARCSVTPFLSESPTPPAGHPHRSYRVGIQKCDIVFPESVSPARMRSNFELFDYVPG
jgi:hypothetical protein